MCLIFKMFQVEKLLNYINYQNSCKYVYVGLLIY